MMTAAAPAAWAFITLSANPHSVVPSGRVPPRRTRAMLPVTESPLVSGAQPSAGTAGTTLPVSPAGGVSTVGEEPPAFFRPAIVSGELTCTAPNTIAG